MEQITAGSTFKSALASEKPLQVVGTINAISALLAQEAQFKAIYLSGAGVANASYGIPDLAITSLDNVLEDVQRITDCCTLPLLVDIDTGFGSAFNIARSITKLIKAGAAACHIEDQVQAKRCGHRPNKALVSKEEMGDRLKAALDARTNPDFVIMARTDALSTEGLAKTLERIHYYVAQGADMIFFEGAQTLAQYQAVSKACNVPILANITEFGVTPLFTNDELAAAGIQLILYPLTAFRAMNKAARAIYQTIRTKGSQASMLDQMQTREELYDLLSYYDYENKLNELFAKGTPDEHD
jgi:methylisocitrate lyase